MIEEVFMSLIVIFSISFVALFWKNIILLTTSLLTLAIFALRHFHKRNDFITFLIGSITGAFAESICVYFGAWSYTITTFFVPLWLPILWGLSALIIRRFTLEIDKKIK